MKKILVLIPTIAIDGAFFLNTYNKLSSKFNILVATPDEIGFPKYGISKKKLNINEIRKQYKSLSITGLRVGDPENAFLQTCYKGLFRTIKEFKPDIIHCYTEIFSPILSQVALYKMLINRNIKIINYSTENLDRSNKFPHKILGKINAKYTNKIRCLNNEAITEVQKFGVKKKDIVHFGLGVDFSNFEFIQHTLEGKNKFKIGFIGRIVKEKGIVNLLEAMKILGDNYSLEIIGAGPDEEMFKNLAKTNGINNKVNFIGKVDPKSLKNYFKYFDILVVPSLSTKKWKEQFGRVIAEAMASGVPVIGSSSGAIPEVISNMGLVFEEGNSNDLAEKIRSLLTNKNIYNKFVIDGYRFAVKNYSQKAFEKHLENIYKDM